MMKKAITGLTLLSVILLMAGCSQLNMEQPEKTQCETRFVVFGDSQFSRPGVYERLIHEVNMLNPDFVIQVGDLVVGYTHNEKTIREEWARFLFQIAPLTMPFYPVPGNHDVVTPESEKVYGEIWGQDKYYYSFDNGPVHCVVLDCWWKEEDDRIAQWQRDWLKKDLQEYAEKHGGKGSEELGRKAIFVYLHSPLWRYSEDTDSRRDWNKVHEILKQYPVKLVVAGHTHEYVWENRDGIDYLVINSAAGGQNLERGGKFYAYLHVSVSPDGEVRYASVKSGSILPIDTVNSEERGIVPGYDIRGGTIRIPEWKQGEPLVTEVSVSVKNTIGESRLYRLDWKAPYGANVSFEPSGMWLELEPGESAKPDFEITTDSAPGPDMMPWLEIKTEKELRTGYVSREWEKKYRENHEKAEADPDVIESSIPLEAPVTFSARYSLFVPPVAEAVKRKGEIKIDGNFEEPAWDHAEVIDDFTAGEGEPETDTRVRLLYDEDYLYVAAWMEEPGPENLTTNAEGLIALTWSDDDFELFFDPGQTQSSYLRLFQNAEGTRFNSLPRNVPDKYFRSDYESEIQIGEDYWTIEMKIPWSDIDLEQGPEKGDVWGFNIGRHRQQSHHKEQRWAGGLYNPARYGLLKFH